MSTDKNKTTVTDAKINVVLVKRPITDNSGDTLETINLSSQDQVFTREQFEEALKKIARPLPKAEKEK